MIEVKIDGVHSAGLPADSHIIMVTDTLDSDVVTVTIRIGDVDNSIQVVKKELSSVFFALD